MKLTPSEKAEILQWRKDEIASIKAEDDIDMLKAYLLSNLLYGDSSPYDHWREIADKNCTSFDNEEVECANIEALESAIIEQFK